MQNAFGANTDSKRFLPLRICVFMILAFCFCMAGILLFFSSGRPESTVHSFREQALTLSEGWTLTDSSGTSSQIQLPYTVEYGKDGAYTLEGVLPDFDALIGSPAFCFYSNYTDFRVKIDGTVLYVYPDDKGTSDGATGNTYHFVRLPSDCAGKTIQVELSCQLGNGITYLLKAPLLGSKATMLYSGIMQSLPCILLAGCMVILAVVLAVFHLFLKRRLKLNSATAYTALFAVLFAVYVFCETYFAQLVSLNGYALFTVTLMLLALLPIPLLGLFAEDVSAKFKHVPVGLMLLCSANFVGQVILHYTDILSLRVMIPATHATIIISIPVMIVCLLMSDKTEKPEARKKLLAALPMLAGGVLDIVLLTLNKPSFNNSLWFTMGVTAFVVIQFIRFTRGFFILYRTSLEASVLHDMAYCDMLTGTGNRNAYERMLNELSERNTQENLYCIIVDINDVKLINDRYGHAMGDAAIVETSDLMKTCLPSCASCFRTGGDEFVALLDGLDSGNIDALVQKLTAEAEHRGDAKMIPLSIAVGSGCYEPGDGSILDFIRRADVEMYRKKRMAKQNESYRFHCEQKKILS